MGEMSGRHKGATAVLAGLSVLVVSSAFLIRTACTETRNTTQATADATTRVIAGLEAVVQAFRGGSRDSFTSYVQETKDEYALKVASTRGELHDDHAEDWLWGWSHGKVRVVAPYESAWTISLESSAWSAEARGKVLHIRCPRPKPDKPYIAYEQIQVFQQDHSYLMSMSSMTETAEQELARRAPQLVEEQSDSALVYQTSKMSVEKWVRQWLGEKFPGLEDTRVEVEFAGPVSRPVGGG
jgi:hypothetical protein